MKTSRLLQTSLSMNEIWGGWIAVDGTMDAIVHNDGNPRPDSSILSWQARCSELEASVEISDYRRSKGAWFVGHLLEEQGYQRSWCMHVTVTGMFQVWVTHGLCIALPTFAFHTVPRKPIMWKFIEHASLTTKHWTSVLWPAWTSMVRSCVSCCLIKMFLQAAFAVDVTVAAKGAYNLASLPNQCHGPIALPCCWTFDCVGSTAWSETCILLVLHQNVDWSWRCIQTSQTLRLTSPVLSSTSRCFQVLLELREVL